MKDEKYYEIKEELNKTYYDDILDGEIIVCGVKMFLNEFIENNRIEETLTAECGTEFSRSGLKIISYERWVETNWSDWN